MCNNLRDKNWSGLVGCGGFPFSPGCERVSVWLLPTWFDMMDEDDIFLLLSFSPRMHATENLAHFFWKGEEALPSSCWQLFGCTSTRNKGGKNLGHSHHTKGNAAAQGIPFFPQLSSPLRAQTRKCHSDKKRGGGRGGGGGGGGRKRNGFSMMPEERAFRRCAHKGKWKVFFLLLLFADPTHE